MADTESDPPTRQPRDRAPIPDDPRLVPFFPLVYVAWSDRVLTNAEIEFVHDRLERVPGIDDGGQEFLDAWLDPDAPPDPESLQDLLRAIRRAASDLSTGERRSLSRLGLEIARRAGEDGGETMRAETEVLEALEDVERVLGVVGPEATRELLRAELPAEREEDAPPLAPLPPYEASFDVDALRSMLDGEHAGVRERVRRLLSGDGFRHHHDLDREAYREAVWRRVLRLADEGLGSLAYPEAFGGDDDVGGAFAVFETLAHHDLSLAVKYGVQFGLFGMSILQLGTRKHHERYLPAVGRGELPGCFAMTETGHGSNVRDLGTTATHDPETGEFVIHTPNPRARKDYIGNAALHGRLATVFAQLHAGEDHHGVHAFLVPLRDDAGRTLPGVSIEDCGKKAGLEGVDNGRIRFDRVRVPRDALLDRFGRVTEDGTYESPIRGASRRFYTMLGTLVAGRISVAAASVSAAKSGLLIAVRYGDRRRQFGPAGGDEVPVLDYLVHQRRLLPRLATTFGLHFAIRDLMHGYLASEDDDELRRKIESRAAGLKAYASTHGVETLQACRELCGGQGYLAVNRLGPLRADVDVFTTFEGANPVLLQLVARSLLTGFGEEFEELRLWGVMKHFADRAIVAVTERNPLAARRSGEEHLRDAEFQAGALRYREDRLLRSAALRLRGRIEQGTDSFQAMNEVQDHLLSLASAHVERVLHDAFGRAVQRAGESEKEVDEPLAALRDLYALRCIERDRGWYLESGYIEARKAKGIRTQVNDLCGELREHARGLVDAFGVPDPVLAAPIALETGSDGAG